MTWKKNERKSVRQGARAVQGEKREKNWWKETEKAKPIRDGAAGVMRDQLLRKRKGGKGS